MAALADSLTSNRRRYFQTSDTGAGIHDDPAPATVLGAVAVAGVGRVVLTQKLDCSIMPHACVASVWRKSSALWMRSPPPINQLVLIQLGPR